MPDDPKRTENEQTLEALLLLWQQETNVELLQLVESGYTPATIPARHWDRIRTQLVRKLEPHLQIVQFRAAERLLQTLSGPMSLTSSLLDSTRRASQMAEEYTDHLMQSVRDILEMQVRRAKENDVSIALLLVILLTGEDGAEVVPRYKQKRDSITLNTASITAGERSAGRQVNELQTRNNLWPLQSVETPESVSSLTLVAHWMKEDEDACPFCTGLHGKPESEWPSEVASGPPAHPS